MTEYELIGLGEELKKAREESGAKLADVTAQLRIREDHLRALEEENFDELPGEVYVLGFIRTYATHLNLNASDMISRFKASRQPVVLDDGPTQEELENEPISTALKIGLGVAGVIVFYIMWLLASSSDRPVKTAESNGGTDEVAIVEQAEPAQTAESDASQTEIETPTPPITAAPAAQPTTNKAASEVAPAPKVKARKKAKSKAAQRQRIVEIRANRRTWMRLENEEGRILFSSIINPGKGVRLDEESNYALATRDAGALEFSVDGVTVEPLGRRGQILTQRRISRSDILAKRRRR